MLDFLCAAKLRKKRDKNINYKLKIKNLCAKPLSTEPGKITEQGLVTTPLPWEG